MKIKPAYLSKLRRNLLISNLITKKVTLKFQEFSEKLISWYKANYRRLPWRSTDNAYNIWISEVILQQTRVVQGLPYYQKFVDKYPTVNHLASASDNEVLRLWQGLGYYSRARNLLKCARLITEQYNSKFPEKYSELLKLPGIGKYTAAAIASFAFGEKVAVVDGNVYRVLSRIFGDKKDISDSSSHEHFKKLSEKLIHENRPDLYNQALMELGATICTPKKPQCHECPLNNSCYAFEKGLQDQFPVKNKKVKVSNRKFFYILLFNKDGCMLKKRALKDIWAEMYDPLWINTNDLNNLEPVLNHQSLSDILNEPVEVYGSDPVKHILSHQRLETSFVHIHKSVLPPTITFEGQNLSYYTWDEVAELPKPVLVNDHLKKNGFI